MSNKKIVSGVADAIFSYFIEKDSLDLLKDVIADLQKRVTKNTAQIYSPRELENNEKAAIKKMIVKLAGEEVYDFVFIKDESLIDGLKVRFSDKIWDFSLAGSLSDFKKKK